MTFSKVIKLRQRECKWLRITEPESREPEAHIPLYYS